jgi:hypothetical protein
MSNSKPSLSPKSTTSLRTATATGAGTPSALPPMTAGEANGDCGCGSSTAKASRPAAAQYASLQAPSLRPERIGAASGVAETWHSNVHVVGLWSINQDRNCWVYLDTAGWRNLSGASETGLMVMNMLAAHAYQTASATSLYEENDGPISQLYVW